MAKKHSIPCWAMTVKNRFSSAVVTSMALATMLVFFLTSNARLKPGNLVRSLEWEDSEMGCDLFSGKWVFDNVSYPLYSEKQCSFMSDQLACEKFGRENLEYQNWRWQPNDCNLPRFNGTALLESLNGKRMVFVGDSLNRGQWVSMVCLLDSIISNPSHKSKHSNGSLITFRSKDYNASVEFYWAPLLVESNSDDPVNHRLPDRIVRVESITKHAKHWMGADILVFNSYLWWRRDTMKVLWGSFEDEDGLYKELETLRTFRMALRTWSDWIEAHVDSTRTKLFWVSMSPTHFWSLSYCLNKFANVFDNLGRGDEWGKSGNDNCYNEIEPITREGYRGKGSDIRMMDIVEEVIMELKTKGLQVKFLNITQLSEYRKDGHPSIYRKQWEPLNQEQINNPSSYADCIHWCLPGVPDAWNEILYAYIFSDQL